MCATRVVTFRLPQEQVAELETIARFDGVALAEELREGVELLLEARRNDPEFLIRVQESLEKAASILARAEGGEAVRDALRPKGVETSVPRSKTGKAPSLGESASAR